MQKRRSFFKKLTGLAAALGLSSLPLSAMQRDKLINGRFVHMVFFWLKEGESPSDFIQSTEAFLNKVEEITSYHLGEPAMTPRDIVDNTYSVSLVVTFDSKEDQDIYQDHAAHLQYIEENKHRWTTVKIFDSWGAN